MINRNKDNNEKYSKCFLGVQIIVNHFISRILLYITVIMHYGFCWWAVAIAVDVIAAVSFVLLVLKHFFYRATCTCTCTSIYIYMYVYLYTSLKRRAKWFDLMWNPIYFTRGPKIMSVGSSSSPVGRKKSMTALVKSIWVTWPALSFSRALKATMAVFSLW